jgi:ribonuclease-3
MRTSVEEVQKIIGYCFRGKELLDQALTHRSAAGPNNERLEFLGDSVLGFLIAEKLYRRFPCSDEGSLTRYRARLVRQETLATVARNIGIGRLVLLGGSAAGSGGVDRSSILSDVVEAVIGAVYLDGGLENAAAVVETLLHEEFETIDSTLSSKDPKSELQELLQKFGRTLPKYVVTEARGVPHKREFVVECVLDDPLISFFGKGSSHRKAEQNAAEIALLDLRLHSVDG